MFLLFLISTFLTEIVDVPNPAPPLAVTVIIVALGYMYPHAILLAILSVSSYSLLISCITKSYGAVLISATVTGVDDNYDEKFYDHKQVVL